MGKQHWCTYKTEYLIYSHIYTQSNNSNSKVTSRYYCNQGTPVHPFQVPSCKLHLTQQQLLPWYRKTGPHRHTGGSIFYRGLGGVEETPGGLWGHLGRRMCRERRHRPVLARGDSSEDQHT